MGKSEREKQATPKVAVFPGTSTSMQGTKSQGKPEGRACEWENIRKQTTNEEKVNKMNNKKSDKREEKENKKGTRFWLRNKTNTENGDKEGDEEQISQNSTKKNRRSIMGPIVLIFVAVLILAGVYVQTSDKNYNSYEVIEDTGVQNTAVADYIPYQNALLKYSKDGATYVDERGNAIWNETFAMKMPTADVCGEYAAIADLNGNDVYIFNKEGKVSSTTMPYKVSDVEVANQGEFAVILEGERENYINIYDKNGECILEMQTTIDKSGYPMDVDLSDDGEKMFSTYLYLDGATIRNGLAAYNFGVVGQMENADRLMGGYQMENTIVPRVAFLDNNTICAFGDNQFILYSMRQKPSEKAKILFDKEVKSVVYNQSYVGVVIPNEDNSTAGAAPYVLELYNTSGRRVMKKEIDFQYEKVQMNQDEIVFTGGTECKIYTTSGSLKFSYVFEKNVVDLIPTGYNRRYIVLYENGSEVIRLKHDREKERN